MSSNPWILKTFQIDHTGATGAHLFIEARQPGLFAFILNIIGLDPTAQLKVTRGSVSFRSTSLSGMTETSTSLTQTSHQFCVASTMALWQTKHIVELQHPKSLLPVPH